MTVLLQSNDCSSTCATLHHFKTLSYYLLIIKQYVINGSNICTGYAAVTINVTAI